uniref:Snake toxin/toxin-like domain-containing protein n=1 Tax=Trichuris muris TaxID=70415 RepID=A0A5S6QI31_TRIMR
MSRSGRSTSALTEATTSSVQDVSESQVDFGVDHGGIIQSSAWTKCAELCGIVTADFAATGELDECCKSRECHRGRHGYLRLGRLPSVIVDNVTLAMDFKEQLAVPICKWIRHNIMALGKCFLQVFKLRYIR